MDLAVRKVLAVVTVRAAYLPTLKDFLSTEGGFGERPIRVAKRILREFERFQIGQHRPGEESGHSTFSLDANR